MEALLAALSLEGEEVVRKTVVLVGVTGDGKSSTGNSLCGLLAFKTSGGLQSETQAPTFSDYRRAGTFWRVIDTIGLEDTGLPRTEVLRRFGLFSDYATAGIDSFLFVVRFGRFKPEHDASLAAFAANVGDAALARTLLVLTHCTLPAHQLVCALRDDAPQSLKFWLKRMAGAVGVENATNAAGAGECVQAALDDIVRAHPEPYSNAAIHEARRRQDLTEEAERAAFSAAVSDWRKTGEGPVRIERGSSATATAAGCKL